MMIIEQQLYLSIDLFFHFSKDWHDNLVVFSFMAATIIFSYCMSVPLTSNVSSFLVLTKVDCTTIQPNLPIIYWSNLVINLLSKAFLCCKNLLPQKLFFLSNHWQICLFVNKLLSPIGFG